MASETTFDHWKVVFSWGKMRKSRFSQNPLRARFWTFGFLIYTSSSANFKKNPPWYIFFVSVHVPATSVLHKSCFAPVFLRLQGYSIVRIALRCQEFCFLPCKVMARRHPLCWQTLASRTFKVLIFYKPAQFGIGLLLMDSYPFRNCTFGCTELLDILYLVTVHTALDIELPTPIQIHFAAL